MRPLWPAATLLRSRYFKGLLVCPNLFMSGLNCVCVLEESETDSRREYGHEPSPNDGHRLRLLLRSGSGQAVPTSHWLNSDPREEAKPWIEEWTAVQRHWTKILLGHKSTCPGAQMYVSLGLRIFPVSKMSPSSDKQTENCTRWLFRARQCWSGLSAGDLYGAGGHL